MNTKDIEKELKLQLKELSNECKVTPDGLANCYPADFKFDDTAEIYNHAANFERAIYKQKLLTVISMIEKL